MSRSHGVLVMVIAFGAVLIFANLGNRLLWEDEAETALLAKSVLRVGVPIAWDGRDLISQECGTDYDANYLWRQTPWLPIYLTALSFKLFGVGTVSARLPAAVIGVLSVLSLYVLACSLFADRTLAVLATTLLVLSVPFLLHVRQARYYALAILATIWVLYFFFELLRDRRFALLGLTLALTVLFHSSYLAFFATVAGLALAFVTVGFEAPAGLRLAGAGVATLVINLGSLAVFDVQGKAGTVKSCAFASTLGAIVLVAVLVGMRFALPRGKANAGWPAPKACLSLAVFALGHVLFVSVPTLIFFRYVITLLPVFALLQAAVLRALWQEHRLLAVTACTVLLFVDRADLLHGDLGSTPFKYLDEITHDVPGPIAGLVTYLRATAKPGDRVFISYGDLPLRFHTDLEVRGGMTCQNLAGWPLPDWLVVRYFYPFRTDSPGMQKEAEWTLRYLHTQIPMHVYREVELPYVDTIWESIPEPDSHIYRTPSEGRRVTIHRKVVPGPAPPR